RGNLGESVPPLMADQREEIGEEGDAGPFRIGTRKPDREAEPGPELPGPSIGNVQADPKVRSEEHTSELQALTNLVCRLLLEKMTPARRSLPGAEPQRPRLDRAGTRTTT